MKVVPVGRNRAVLGRVETGSERWAKMFDVGVRTLARCSDEFLIDGVKRNCGGLSPDEVMILTERRHISAR